MNRKGQAAMEYMSMIGIALVILAGLTSFAYFWTTASKETLSLATADNTVFNIVESANLVYAQGYPAKTTIIVQIPQNVESVTIQNNTIAMRLKVRGGFTDVSASAKANIVGSLPSNSGYYKITIQSFGDYVDVSQE